MSDLEPIDLHPILDEFRQTLEECSELYRASAAECSRSNADLANESRKEFVRRMVDLSHGLALKIFVEVAYVDRHWDAVDLALAGVLVEHIWDRRLTPEQIKKALQHFQDQANTSWDALLGPFERL